MKPYQILITDAAVRPEGLKMLEEVAELRQLPPYSSPEALVAAAKGVDAILARTAVISKPVINASSKLKIVSRHGVGVDNVDVAECTRLGIVVAITGDANSQAVSEHAFGCMLAVARKIAQANAHVRSGRWVREQFIGVELYRKVLGIIGLGRIGSRLARQAAAFEMEVIAYDPYLSAEAARPLNVPLVALETLLRRADFITLHLPLTEETRNLIGPAELDLMKPAAIVVNTARGGLVDEQALYQALAEKRIAGAALDVFEQEPLAANHPLMQLDNLVCSPHVAGQTQEALLRMSVGAAENILRVLRGKPPSFTVNPEVLHNSARITWQSSTE